MLAVRNRLSPPLSLRAFLSQCPISVPHLFPRASSWPLLYIISWHTDCASPLLEHMAVAAAHSSQDQAPV